MRPSSPRPLPPLATAALAALGACGTIGSRSTGDVDLPAGYLGAYQQLATDQTPQSSNTLVSASAAGAQVDEPSVVRLDGRRFAYVTYLAAGAPSAIGLAQEPAASAGDLLFSGAVPVLSAELPWEMGAVASPGALADGPSQLWLAYAAGGAIGLAHSTDGTSFTREPAPILSADPSNGEASALEAPSLARAQDGQYWLAYASGGSLFVAHASAPQGPWQRVAGAVLAPQLDAVAGDAGGTFESLALGDPGLAIVSTAAGRPLFALFYTAHGPGAADVLAGAASFDGAHFTRAGRTLYSERNLSLRAGSLDPIDERTALLWFGTGMPGRRFVSAALGPALPRVGPTLPR